MSREVRESEQVLFGLQSVNARQCRFDWSPQIQVQYHESIGNGIRAPTVRGQMSRRVHWVWEEEMEGEFVVKSDREKSYSLSP